MEKSFYTEWIRTFRSEKYQATISLEINMEKEEFMLLVRMPYKEGLIQAHMQTESVRDLIAVQDSMTLGDIENIIATAIERNTDKKSEKPEEKDSTDKNKEPDLDYQSMLNVSYKKGES